MNLRFTIASLILWGASVLVQGRPNGPPEAACASMTPQHGVEAQDPLDFPYSVKIFRDGDPAAQKAQLYSTCNSYIVRISGPKPFKGFMLEARPDTGPDVPLGEFLEDASWATQGIQHLDCGANATDEDRNVVGHSDPHPRTLLLVRWRPKHNVGRVQFLLTIVQSKTVFWAHEKVGTLKPDGIQCDDYEDISGNQVDGHDIDGNNPKNSPLNKLLGVLNRVKPVGGVGAAPAARPPTTTKAPVPAVKPKVTTVKPKAPVDEEETKGVPTAATTEQPTDAPEKLSATTKKTV